MPEPILFVIWTVSYVYLSRWVYKKYFLKWIESSYKGKHFKSSTRKSKIRKK